MCPEYLASAQGTLSTVYGSLRCIIACFTTLFLASADSAGITREMLSTADSRGYANVTFSDVEVSVEAALGEIDGGWEALPDDIVCDTDMAGGEGGGVCG